MTASLNPFGFGTRICGGQNLAQIMLRIGVAVIARNCHIEVPPETTEKSMAIRDAFVSSLSVEQMGRKVDWILSRSYSRQPWSARYAAPQPKDAFGDDPLQLVFHPRTHT